MGDDKLNAMLYAIHRDTKEKFAIGKVISELTTDEMLEVEENNTIANLGENLSTEMIIKLKTITKKRFIKLLMAKGYQKNQAIKIHNEYMQKHKARSRIGLEVFINIRDKQLENVEYKLESEDN